MNYSKAVFLINDEVRAVAATYETPDAQGREAPRTLFKTLDPDLKVGDLAIVPTTTRHGFTIVKIVATDIDVDFDASDKMEWIAGVFDRAAYDKIMALEGKAIAAVQSAERRRKRDELRTSMFKDQAETLKALELSTIDATPEIHPSTQQ